jgi:hypothetical protein
VYILFSAALSLYSYYFFSIHYIHFVSKENWILDKTQTCGVMDFALSTAEKRASISSIAFAT